VVRLLLSRSASPTVRTESGATAMKWALQAQHTEIAELLRKAGATE